MIPLVMANLPYPEATKQPQTFTMQPLCLSRKIAGIRLLALHVLHLSLWLTLVPVTRYLYLRLFKSHEGTGAYKQAAASKLPSLTSLFENVVRTGHYQNPHGKLKHSQINFNGGKIFFVYSKSCRKHNVSVM